MAYDPELWKALNLGDRVRVVSWPTEFDQPDYCLHEETREAYEWLLARRCVLTIDRVEYHDGQSYPWADFTITTYGVDAYHTMMLNHSGLELIE